MTVARVPYQARYGEVPYVPPPGSGVNWFLRPDIVAPAGRYSPSAHAQNIPQPFTGAQVWTPGAGTSWGFVTVFNNNDGSGPTVTITYTDNSTLRTSSAETYQPGAAAKLFVLRPTKQIKSIGYSGTGTWLPLIWNLSGASGLTGEQGTSGATPNPVVNNIANTTSTNAKQACIGWHWTRPGADMSSIGNNQGLSPAWFYDYNAPPNDYAEIFEVGTTSMATTDTLTTTTGWSGGGLYNNSAGGAIYGR